MPMSVLFFNREQSGYHPTQKPVDLMRYLINTYTNKSDTVFDGFMGSGTTAIASIIEDRNFIGAELKAEYFEIATKRIELELSQPKLF
jgi:site-specific DNA-methyltransferase (adenine-specific)